ncbi:uncharacterized protein LOC108253698 isoform X1 [Diaphorina citri]|uniref:Uncharacterized protein LOC108253698 isoform X1 n=1 Tax=Diaphorina citri TaxID=121845 RepID=A0A1S4EN87_DIACI|nr:uncharacterized protein LOC108253698 isoform X2 [Diaphorina citri]XP_026686644.1 uncharacterized protein LOC108253698 isoform X1 [Diaphorina citri]
MSSNEEIGNGEVSSNVNQAIKMEEDLKHNETPMDINDENNEKTDGLGQDETSMDMKEDPSDQPYPGDSEDAITEDENETGTQSGPQFTEEVKNKLMYTDATHSDDHIFWTHAQAANVINFKKRLLHFKNQLEKNRSQGIFNNGPLIKKIAESERMFKKMHIKKIKVDNNLPTVDPLPEDLRDFIHRRTKNEVEKYKTKACAEQIGMRVRLKRLRKHCNILNFAENKYASYMLNLLHNKEREYAERFVTEKTQEEMEIELQEKEKAKLEAEATTTNKPIPKPWHDELTPAIKQHLMYSNEPCTHDHIFWVNTTNNGVVVTKQKLSKLRQNLDLAIKKDSKDQIEAAERKLKEKEDYFVNEFINKVEYDSSLPTISPITRDLRHAIYNEVECVKMFKTQLCKEQADMLKSMRAKKKMYNQMVRIKNKFAPDIANEMYHKEIEYKERFLTLRDPNSEETALENEKTRQKKWNQRKKQRLLYMKEKGKNKTQLVHRNNRNRPFRKPYDYNPGSDYYQQGNYSYNQWNYPQSGYQYYNQASSYYGYQHGYDYYNSSGAQYPNYQEQPADSKGSSKYRWTAPKETQRNFEDY